MASSAAGPNAAGGVGLRQWPEIIGEARASGNPNYLEDALNFYLVALHNTMHTHETSLDSHAALIQNVRDDGETALGGAVQRIVQMEVEGKQLADRILSAENQAANYLSEVGQRILRDEDWCKKLQETMMGDMKVLHETHRNGLLQVVQEAGAQLSGQLNRLTQLEASMALLQQGQQSLMQTVQGMPQQQTSQAPSPTPPVVAPAAGMFPYGDPWTQQQAAYQGQQAIPGMGATTNGATATQSGPGQEHYSTNRHSYSVQQRDWGDHKRLALLTEPEGYLVWRERALGYLGKDRSDIRDLLVWAEKQSGEVDSVVLQAKFAELRIPEQQSRVDYALHTAIKFILDDQILDRARFVDGRGVELWRKLHIEWKGTASAVTKAKAMRYQDPIRCSKTEDLWTELPKWVQLGAELDTAGYPLPEPFRVTALEKLVTETLERELIGKTDLDSFQKKLEWVTKQVEHSKGTALAQRQSAAATKPQGKRDTDVDMGSGLLRP